MRPRQFWTYFRLGHATYLAFLLQFANFVLIANAFLVQRLFPEIGMTEFAIIFIGCYVPIAIILGYIHAKKQIHIEIITAFENNPLGAKMQLTMLKAIRGDATKEEIDAAITYLQKIVDKSKTEF